MKKLTFSFKKLRLGQILSVFLAGVFLLLSTACSNADLQGSRPDNLPVQVGGNNNPHKMGGEGSESTMSIDPKVARTASKKQAALFLPSDRLLADTSIRSNTKDLNYPSSSGSKTSNPDVGAEQQKSLPSLPLQKQPVIDRSDPDANILERAGEAIKEATSFVKDTARSASERPELKANPTVGE